MKSVKKLLGEGPIGLYSIAHKSINPIPFNKPYKNIEIKMFSIRKHRLRLPERKVNE